MEQRKEKEVEYYDKQTDKGFGDFEGFNPGNLSSYGFLYNFLRDKCDNKKILDFGCGNGIHSVFLAKSGGQVTGIDLSENQLETAEERVRKEGFSDKINFIKMDCEKMEFPASFFDIIFDGGTFSSLDFKIALPGLARILKPEGFLLGIETFGHNPFTNLKRKLNQASGKRTEWATGHIFQMKDLEEVKNTLIKLKLIFFT